ncbi:MAG: 4Fe-4S dicluster domain-containing protein, partial [Proteobacteria bacterium]|nr:4Fe-4S dicluster domain-containing protein [Pseudomonadota bacterium]
QRHSLAKPDQPFDEMAVLEKERRMDEHSYTVVNKYYPQKLGSLVWRQRPTFVKFQCMHCQDPACVSACIVGALTKQENGSVIYDAAKCIGCRYCMVACPFQIPAYEYHDPLTPRVRKCTFCFERISQAGGKPGCAQVCPVEAITFGKRSELIKLAKQKMADDPGRYQPQVYGEKEVGGTSWLYISREPFAKVGFLKLPSQPMPHLTETIQHGIFSYMWAPLSLFALLGGAMAVFNRKRDQGEDRS